MEVRARRAASATGFPLMCVLDSLLLLCHPPLCPGLPAPCPPHILMYQYEVLRAGGLSSTGGGGYAHPPFPQHVGACPPYMAPLHSYAYPAPFEEMHYDVPLAAPVYGAGSRHAETVTHHRDPFFALAHSPAARHPAPAALHGSVDPPPPTSPAPPPPPKARKGATVGSTTTVRIVAPAHQCQHCPYVCMHLSDMKKHVRTHTGERPYECPVCFAKFSRSDNLGTHLDRVHSQPREYVALFVSCSLRGAGTVCCCQRLPGRVEGGTESRSSHPPLPPPAAPHALLLSPSSARVFACDTVRGVDFDARCHLRAAPSLACACRVAGCTFSACGSDGFPLPSTVLRSMKNVSHPRSKRARAAEEE